MKRILLFLALIFLFAVPAYASTTFTNLPAANVPIGSSGTTGPTYVPLDQGAGCITNTSPCQTAQIDGLRLGQPIQTQCNTLLTPWQYQQCIDTSVTPHILKEYIGTTWWPIFNLSTSGPEFVLPVTTLTSPFFVGSTQVTTTGTQLNYLNIATGFTGTGLIVYNTSPTIDTPAVTGGTFDGGTFTSPTIDSPTIDSPAVTGGTFSGGSFSSPTITSPSVTGGSFSHPTLTSPTESNGTYSGGTFGGGSFTNPTISGGSWSSGTLTTPTITTPAISGGTYSGGTFTSPTINTPTISTPTVSGGTYSGGTFGSPTINTPTIATPTISNGSWSNGSLSSPTLTSPTESSGTYTGGTFGSPTINTPTINTPSVSNGTYSGGTFSSPTINTATISSPTISNGSWSNGSLSSPTLTSPTESSGTYTGGTFGSPTINTPTITTPTISNGSWSNGSLSSPTLTSPTESSGTYSGGTFTGGTFGSPTINTPTITTPTVSGGTYSGGTFSSPSISSPTISSPSVSGGTFSGPTITSPGVTGGTYSGGTFTSPTINSAGINSATISSSLLVSTPSEGATNIAPQVPNVVVLQNSCTTTSGCPGGDLYYPNGVWRNDFASGIGAPPLFYLPYGAACPAADNGVQVSSADGKCWVAQIPEAGVDVREYGAHCDWNGSSGTDDYVSIQAAINGRSSPGGTVVLPENQCYVATSSVLIPPRVNLRGVAFTPDSAQPSGSGIVCPVSIGGSGGACVFMTGDGTGNGFGSGSPGLSNATISFTGTPNSNDYAVFVAGGSNPMLDHVRAYNSYYGFAFVGTDNGGALYGIGASVDHLYTAIMYGHHVLISNWSSLQVSLSRFGSAQSIDVNTAGSYVFITGGSAGGEEGPNKISFVNNIFNQQNNAPNCMVSFSGLSNTGYTAGEFKFIGNHFENPNNQSGQAGIFCAGAYSGTLYRLNLTGNTFEQTTANIFDFSAAVQPVEWEIVGNDFECIGSNEFALAPSSAMTGVNIVGNQINCPSHFTSNSGGNLNLVGNTYVGNMTVDGAADWSQLDIGGFFRSGGLVNSTTSTSNINVHLPRSQAGLGCSVGLAFGGDPTGFSYSIQSCSYTIADGVVTVSFNLTLASKGSNTGFMTLINLPKPSSGSPYGVGGGSTIYAVLLNSVITPVTVNVQGANTSANVYYGDPAGGGVLGITNTNVNNNSIFAGTITYAFN